MATLQRRVELSHAVPLLGDRARVDGAVGSPYEAFERAVIATVIDTVDALVVRAPDAWAEPPTEHREGSEVDLCVAVAVGVVLVEFQVALVVQEPVENERGVAVGASIGVL